jgi:putative ABC transport system permease protein
VVLLAGAGLLIRTFMNVASTSGGFRREGVLTAEITLSADRYKTNDSVRNFYEQALARVRALPGVESADISTTLPLMGWVAGVVFRLEGQANDSEHRSNANLQAISDSYFKTMGIPIVRGRAFGAVDTATSTRVAIIDQHLANRLFNDTDPIGKRIIRSGDPVLQVPDSVVQVVGVAADVKDEDLDAPAADDIYFPYKQSPIRWEYLEVRSGSDSAALLPSIRNAIASVDPDQPIEDVATMQQRLDESLGPRRFSMTLLVAFSAIALVLAAIGLYGVVSYAVAQRTREFGLRVALGASPEQVTKLVLRRGLFLAGVGAAIGVVLALAASRVMKAMLFGVSTADPLAFAAAVTVLISVALLAIYIPARRATKVDPMVALRYE